MVSERPAGHSYFEQSRLETDTTGEVAKADSGPYGRGRKQGAGKMYDFKQWAEWNRTFIMVALFLLLHFRILEHALCPEVLWVSMPSFAGGSDVQ